jgi:hypothetical protein
MTGGLAFFEALFDGTRVHGWMGILRIKASATVEPFKSQATG